MLECSLMFEAYRKQPKKFPVLEKQGIVRIKFNGQLDSYQISKILSDIHFILSVYKRGCKKIYFVCNGIFKPKDMFVYVLFETFIYTLRCKYNYEVGCFIPEAQAHIHAPGLKDSLLVYFNNDNFDIILMEKNYRKIHNRNHFRRIICKDDIQGASVLLGELKLFLSIFNVDREYALGLAKVAAELADNASEHAGSDCLVDIFISDPVYKKKGCDDDFYAISMVVINFSNRSLNYGIRTKIETRDYKAAERYDLVAEAYENHKPYFRVNQYEADDFFNLASFQDRISGRKSETKTGGTGLTDLIKSLEDMAEAHCCYVLSGNKGLWFEPQYLKYNQGNWIGFNESNDFIASIPDKKIIVRSNVDFFGTGYNFALLVKKEENNL